MARQNVPLLSIGNRGIVSPKALARVDLDRTRLSAEVFRNWLGAAQGSLSLRPGTKYFGSSLNDTGAEFIEFVASTDDVALLEMTAGKMRIWLGSDAHNLSLLSRPHVDTALSISDTGWSNASTGGAIASANSTDLIPTMTGATTDGVTITASSQNAGLSNAQGGGDAWHAADDSNGLKWVDTGFDATATSLPSWLNVDFGTTKAVGSYSIRASNSAASLPDAPSAWRLLASNYDTGTHATDTGKWTLEDERSGETGWAASEKRSYETDQGDTGTVTARRHWRLYFTALAGGGVGSTSNEYLEVAEIEMFESASSNQVLLSGGKRIFNATARGSVAKSLKRVIVDTGDLGVEHSLAITVERGPLTLRVGSSSGDDDYIRETNIGTGYHNLAFTPTSDFYVLLQTSSLANRILSSIGIGDSGTVEVVTPWDHENLDDVRYDQSADVVFVDCDGVRPQKIERRGTGRSWSVVDYVPINGPFLPLATTSAKLTPSQLAAGNAQLMSDLPFFTANHVGANFRIFHEGQSGSFNLGAKDAVTDVIEVTGIGDTGGTPDATSERRISFSVSGSYSGTVTIERSMDGKTLGFKPISTQLGQASDTGTFTRSIDDPDDNIKVWYRAKLTGWASGVAVVNITYKAGGKTGYGRVTGFNSNTSVDIETATGFSQKGDTGYTTNWQESYWSDQRGHPSAIALHGGRATHAQGGNVFASVSDDYENFDESVTGDAGPFIRTLGSGPVDRIHYLLSLLRLIIGTAGAEIAIKSSSLDEPLTPDNCSATTFSTQGSANLRAIKMDARGLFVQRSGQRLFMVGAGTQGTTFGDYENFELTLLVPDLLKAGIVSIAVQRQPDTRIHCVLGDGSVAILTYEPQEEVMCWSTWSTDGFVERAMALPAANEDAVYYHIRRTINGVTKRYLEKWAMESECNGDTGLSWLADCAVSMTDTGRSTTLSAPHLAGKSVIVWGTDTGTGRGKDYSPDSDSGVQLTYALDTGGNGAIGTAVKHKVLGLPYDAMWKSTKLAYAAELGTALSQQKRVPQLALSVYQMHNNGLHFGTDSGDLDPLPRMMEDEAVDADRIYETLDMVAVSMPDRWHPDIRLFLKARAPRPATVLAAIPTVVTSEK